MKKYTRYITDQLLTALNPVETWSGRNPIAIRVSLAWLKFQKGLFSQDIKIIYSKQLRIAYMVCFCQASVCSSVLVSSQQWFGTTDIKALGMSQLSNLGQTVSLEVPKQKKESLLLKPPHMIFLKALTLSFKRLTFNIWRSFWQINLWNKGGDPY